jgi:hypothetical protein
MCYCVRVYEKKKKMKKLSDFKCVLKIRAEPDV